MAPLKRIAIIGGGISGLSAAFFIEQQRGVGTPVEYVLYESSSRFGGVIQSDHVDGCLIEGGADSFLTEKPWVADLCRQLGIGGELVTSNDADRKTYILLNRKLVPIPDGLAFMVPTKIVPVVSSRLFSIGTKFRMAREWIYRPTAVNEDETVAAFVERHYGKQMVDRLVDPLLSGVYGADSGQLSLRAVLPRFAEMQTKHGSLGRAAIDNRRALRRKGAEKALPIFTTLKDGMQELVDAMVRVLPAACVRNGIAIRTLRLEGIRWAVLSDHAKDREFFDCIIVAAPAYVAAELLSESASALASELQGIQYSSSVTATLGYEEKVLRLLPPGFGFLIPRSEKKRLLAGTFVHNKFAGRAPQDRALIRCFLGGTRDEEVVAAGDSEILEIVLKELGDVLGITEKPLFTRVYKWRKAMAQYNVGHLDRISRIEGLSQKTPGIFLAGNAYHGIGVPDCVRSGQEAARGALKALLPK